MKRAFHDDLAGDRGNAKRRRPQGSPSHSDNGVTLSASGNSATESSNSADETSDAGDGAEKSHDGSASEHGSPSTNGYEASNEESEALQAGNGIDSGSQTPGLTTSFGTENEATEANSPSSAGEDDYEPELAETPPRDPSSSSSSSSESESSSANEDESHATDSDCSDDFSYRRAQMSVKQDERDKGIGKKRRDDDEDGADAREQKRRCDKAGGCCRPRTA